MVNLNAGGFIGALLAFACAFAAFYFGFDGEIPSGPWRLCFLAAAFGGLMGNGIWSVYIAKDKLSKDNEELAE